MYMSKKKGLSKDEGFVFGLVAGLIVGTLFFNMLTGLILGLSVASITSLTIANKVKKEAEETSEDS